MDDDEILSCVAEALGISPNGGEIAPLAGKQGLIVCRVTLCGARPVVFKAVKDSGRLELRLSHWLSTVAPYAVAEVLHANEDERRGYYWIILADQGADRLGDRPGLAGYASAASTLARLQIDLMERLDEAAALGVRRVDTRDWVEMALALLGHLDAGEIRGLPCPEALSAALWRSEEMAVAAAILPMSLIHGDLHADNVAIQPDGTVRLLDWGSSYIGQAFLGLSELLWPAERHARQIGSLSSVRKAYLDPWGRIVGKPGRLAGALASCDALARLSVLQEAVRRPERFGLFGAATAANHFIESVKLWERARV